MCSSDLRPDDIPLLVGYLVSKFGQRIGKRLAGVAEPTMQRLREYPWPGNVRELENVLERAVILATGPTLEVAPDLLPTPGRVEGGGPKAAGGKEEPSSPPAQQAPPAAIVPLTLEAVERDHILTVLRHTNWVVTGSRGAARLLGINPSTLRNRIKKLGISRSPG